MHALSFFFLKSYSAYLRGEGVFELKGGRGSFTSSIIYATQKLNSWIYDMFGMDYSGNSVLRTLLELDNVGLRKTRPASISFKKSLSVPKVMKVYVDNVQVVEPDIIDLLAKLIHFGSRGERGNCSFVEDVKRGNVTAVVASNNKKFDLNLLISRIEEERLSESLLSKCSHLNTLEKQFHDNEFVDCLEDEVYFEVKNSLAKIKNLSLDVELNRVAANSKRNVCCEIDGSLTSSEKIGLCLDPRALKVNFIDTKNPIEICVSVSQVGFLSILYYLKYFKGFNLRINTRFSHSFEIFESIANDILSVEPDLCCLTNTCASSVFSASKKYLAYMSAPDVDRQYLFPDNSGGGSLRNLYMCAGNIKDQDYFVSSFSKSCNVGFEQCKVHYSHPINLYDNFAKNFNNSALMSYFPYSKLSKLRNDLSFEKLKTVSSRQPCVLLANKHFLRGQKRARLFNIAVRDAWLQVSSDDNYLRFFSWLISRDKKYGPLVLKYSGIRSEMNLKAEMVRGDNK